MMRRRRRAEKEMQIRRLNQENCDWKTRATELQDTKERLQLRMIDCNVANVIGRETGKRFFCFLIVLCVVVGMVMNM
jgi:hypothetical protein